MWRAHISTYPVSHSIARDSKTDEKSAWIGICEEKGENGIAGSDKARRWPNIGGGMFCVRNGVRRTLAEDAYEICGVI